MFSEYRRKGLLVVGAKQTLKLLNEEKLKEIYIAQDADKYVIRSIEELAEDRAITIIYVESMKKLGKECGISIGAATAGIVKQMTDDN